MSAPNREVLREVGRYGYFDYGPTLTVACPRCKDMCEIERSYMLPVQQQLETAVSNHLPYCEAGRRREGAALA